MEQDQNQVGLARRLGLWDAVWLGLGSMIGAGVFAVWGPAAQSAGSLVLVGLAIAALIALANATSSAQLAAQYPTSGGTYVYGRERLGQWPGFLAGWSFVVGKTASCAAMAMTFAAYALPPAWTKPAAVLAVLALAAVNYVGVTKTAGLARILVVLVLVGLVVWLAVAWGASAPNPVAAVTEPGLYGVLQSAGLLFFAFAGYARIATLGEEVRDPKRTIPLAIIIAFVLVVGLYAVVGGTLLHLLGAGGLTGAPMVAAVGAPWAKALVVVIAALASLGALLGLIAGVGRTSLAMARNRDLPLWLAGVHPRFQTPHRAEVAVALVVCVAIVLTDLRGAIGFSSFGVLLYYAIANAAALTQELAWRRYPRVLPVVGLGGCLLLVATLPLTSVIIGLAVLALGVLGRVLASR